MTFFGGAPESGYVFWLVSFWSTSAADAPMSGRHARSNPRAIGNRFCMARLLVIEALLQLGQSPKGFFLDVFVRGGAALQSRERGKRGFIPRIHDEVDQRELHQRRLLLVQRLIELSFHRRARGE